MKLFSASDIKRIEEYTIANEPITSVNLMERAAGELCLWITSHFGVQHRIVIYAGTGNNGGDGLIVGRMLAGRGYKVSICMLADVSELTNEAQVAYRKLKNADNVLIANAEVGFLDMGPSDVVIDALFGVGLNRPLSGIAEKLVRRINESQSTIIAIDIPSGLFSEDNSVYIAEENPAIIKATYTLTLQQPKLSLLFPENERYVGELHILPIGLHPYALNSFPTSYSYLTAGNLAGLLKKRAKFSHKGCYGHALLVAGSYGMAGAAVLAARSYYRTGGGLLTVHTAGNAVNVLQTAIPEAIAQPDSNPTHTSSIPSVAYSAVGIGSGIGTHSDTAKALHAYLTNATQPLVLDADALNILSEHKEWLSLIPEDSILTPHPKEFERLAGAWTNDYMRLEMLRDFAITYKVAVVLKGAYTTVAFPNGELWFNPTGNPGMATAGSGDVLTGIILAMQAQGYTLRQSALFAVYLHGLAGDVAAEIRGMTPLMASDIIDALPGAYERLGN